MNKIELRKKYLEIRKNISDREKKNKTIYESIINTREFVNSELVLCYVSNNDEVDTFKIIEHSLEIGKKVAVPKCEKDIIKFYYIESLKELKKGCFNILEPQNNNLVTNYDNSICIIPGICFDKFNNRVGYGKGYYDKFLNYYKGIKIGITYKECICEKIDINKYDIKIDKIIFN